MPYEAEVQLVLDTDPNRVLTRGVDTEDGKSKAKPGMRREGWAADEEGRAGGQQAWQAKRDGQPGVVASEARQAAGSRGKQS